MVADVRPPNPRRRPRQGPANLAIPPRDSGVGSGWVPRPGRSCKTDRRPRSRRKPAIGPVLLAFLVPLAGIALGEFAFRWMHRH